MINKIIDIHSHLALHRIYHEDYLYGMTENEGLNLSKAKFINITKIFLNDVEADKHIKMMNDAGIKKSVLLIVDGEIGLGKMNTALEAIYIIHKKILDKHKDRFIVFAGIDPRRENAFEIVKEGIEDYGFRGLKLYPSFGFPMNHPNLDKIYNFCNENELPILIHTGPSINALNNNDYSNPIHIKKVADKYPKCKFILAHAGFKLSNYHITELLKYPNVYFDISGFQSQDLKNANFLEELKLIFNKEYSDKILFGSDWPLFHTLHPLKKDIAFIENLFDSAHKEINTDSLGLQKLMFENAEKILEG